MTTATEAAVIKHLWALELAYAYKGVTAWQIRAEARLNNALIRMFGNLSDDVMSLIRETFDIRDPNTSARLDALMDEYRQSTGTLIDEHDQAAARHGRQTVFDAPGVNATITDFSEPIRNLIRDTAFEASERTMSRITGNVKDSLARSYEQGLGIKEAARELKKEFKGLKDYEARRIARTEINSSQNLGAFQTLIDLGIPYGKWVSEATSPRTRNTHKTQNGEIVQTGHDFTNGLQYPGDRSGPIKEWINCRCRLVPFMMPDGKTAPEQEPFREGDLVSID